MVLTVTGGISLSQGILVSATIAPPGIAGLTMNPADKGSEITLSNGDLTYVNNGDLASYNSVRATSSVSTGFWYWEVFIDSNNGNNTIHGVMTTSAALGGSGDSKWVGFDTEGWGYFGSGGWNAGGTTVAVTTTFADTNDILMFALDISNGKIWFGKNGSWDGGVTPTVNGPGAFYTNLAGETVYAAGSSVGQTSTSRFTVASQTYAAPSGFDAIGA